MRLANGTLPWPWIDPDKALPWVEKHIGLTLAESQVTAIERFGWTFAPGDKIMQIENDYDKEVYNGDIGMIDDVDTSEGALTAIFDGRTVTYEFGELDMLVPAYAATIHKSQGSEYPAVVIPVLTQHYAMLQRNLLYTGVTRGKELVVLIGQKKAIAIAVRNVSGRRRWSKLAEWLHFGSTG
jgi:exodeoxyribonuclease V alpha subunit